MRSNECRSFILNNLSTYVIIRLLASSLSHHQFRNETNLSSKTPTLFSFFKSSFCVLLPFQSKCLWRYLTVQLSYLCIFVCVTVSRIKSGRDNYFPNIKSCIFSNKLYFFCIKDNLCWGNLYLLFFYKVRRWHWIIGGLIILVSLKRNIFYKKPQDCWICSSKMFSLWLEIHTQFDNKH